MAAAVGKGRKEEFGGEMWDIDDIPDPQDERCFLRSKLKWEERFGEEHRHMLGWYSQLLRLRKENSFHGPATVEAAADGTWLRMAVGKFEVVATLTEDASSRFAVAGPFSVVLSNGVVQAMEGGQLHLSGRGVAVIRKQP
jgi:1,4-alpha-glucan branching enzyme